MRILIIGAGSTGGYFGARLMQAGRDVSFLVRPARAAALRANGLQVLSQHGDFHVAPTLVEGGAIAAPYDVVLVTVKAFGLAAAIEDFAPAVGPGTMILTVLNGMKHVDDLQARFGADKVLGGVARVSTTLDAQGRVVQLSPGHELRYGELDGRTTARVEALHAFLGGAGFDAALDPHIAQALWDKWIFLATLSGVCTLGRGNIGEIVATEGGVDFVRAFLDEAAAVATAEGHAPEAQAALPGMLRMLTAAGSAMTSSMYRDLVAGERVEVDQILGDLRARGGRHGLAVPLVSAATIQLAIHQRRLDAR